ISYRADDARAPRAAPPKQAPNFAPSGALAREANTLAGSAVVLKYHEPADARKPPATAAWRLYTFKRAALLATTRLAERSCWLLGRAAAVADLALDHPSASGQHAALQFRHVVRTDPFGDTHASVALYVIDLESANGTVLNGEKIEPARFVE
ncbi:hypothetical protein LTR04_004826, partial [Oleoguttula sp. CCFEE 6159]